MMMNVLLGLLVLMAGAGCSAQSSEAADVMAQEQAFGSEAKRQTSYAGAGLMMETDSVSAYEDAPAEPGLENMSAAETGKTRKLIRRATLHLQVPDLEAAEQPVLAAMNRYGAYAAATETYENSRSYTIRVPERTFQPLLDELKGMGRLLYRSESAEDVTLKYYDLEGRLQTKRELRSTFQKYLGTAKTMEDIMAVETRIMELQNEIDWMGAELRSLVNLVDYATISLEIRGHLSAGAYAKPLLRERLGELFGSFGDYASTVLLILLGIIIYGIPGLVILVLLYWLLLGKLGLMKKLWRVVSEKGKPA